MNNDLQTLVSNYQMSNTTAELIQTTPIVLLVGISGAGKDTIKHHLLDTGGYHHVVSHTTRSPRENAGKIEQNGLDYHFIDQQSAKQMLHDGAFVEAKVYSGNLYGTSAAEILEAKEEGKIAITDIEVQGVEEYKAVSPNVIAMFILPPSYEEWQHRLSARYGPEGANPKDLQKRMHTAIVELQEALRQPYYHFIVNDNLEEAVSAADKIAHGSDEFTRIDRSFHGWAEKLLDDLSKNVD